ncbi:MAG: ABC transporter ATP-binding protein [Acidobacteria bacterium]|nr:ABC transporter ATP-binding protein [Acidobacteriota bacterium]
MASSTEQLAKTIPADTPMLEARNLSFAYSSGRFVVNGVSLKLQRGTMAALLGANGSGKSTLIRLLSGILLPGAGEVLLLGKPIPRIPKTLLARTLAYVPQLNPLSFPFTALEVVLAGRSPHVPRFQFENRLDFEKAWTALETVGASHLAQRPVTELSGGERQLVVFARAIAQAPEWLLLDEPSASLDLKHRAELIRNLVRLRDRMNLTVLLVTHDVPLLDESFDVVFAMRAGAILTAGKPSEILTNEVLSSVYEDPYLQSRNVEGRTFVWSATHRDPGDHQE